MRPVYLDHLSYALGDEVYTVQEAEALNRTVTSASALQEVGFSQHHVAGANTSAYELAFQTVQSIQADLGVIDAVLYATCIPLNGNVGELGKFHETKDVKYLMDFPASRLQAEFGFDRAMILGLNQQACAAMLSSIRIAQMLILQERDIQRVLCITSDRFPEGALYEQAYNLISDGAACCIVSIVPKGFRIIACHGITNGAMAFASDDETASSYFTYSYRLILETIEKAGLKLTDINWFIPQNINTKAIQILSRLLKVPYERFYFPTVGTAGHVISGDNIINLKRLVDDDHVNPGEYALLLMAGYGLNWQCVIVEKQ